MLDSFSEFVVTPNDSSNRKDTHSLDPRHDTQSSASTRRTTTPSNNSRDEPPVAPDTLVIGKLYILNEIYPSIEHNVMAGTPLAFLGAEMLLHTRIDWTKVRYPLSARHAEIIIDLMLVRPSFKREIPKVTRFNLYRPLIRTLTGYLFFDRGENSAGMHMCDRKQAGGYALHKFTIPDLAAIHRREFHIITYNSSREQRFLDLIENLFNIYSYKTRSTEWRSYLTKQLRSANTPDLTSSIPIDDAEIRRINALLTVNQARLSAMPKETSVRKRSILARESSNSKRASAYGSPLFPIQDNEQSTTLSPLLAGD